MPSKKQIDNNRNITDFVPVLGGIYFNGILYDEATRGYWWGSEANNNVTRYMLDYNANNLYIGNSRRSGGFYIRCVSEEKTVTDLTYLQDMTGEIADKINGSREADKKSNPFLCYNLIHENVFRHIHRHGNFATR